MTTLPFRGSPKTGYKIEVEKDGHERRQFRRHELDTRSIEVDRWDGSRRAGTTFGRIVDLSAGGVRIRTNEKSIRPDNQIRLRMQLPPYAGICPFIHNDGEHLAPKNEWVGWMAVARVTQTENGESDVCGRLVDMDELDRGMLGLYLSTQPMAA